MTSATWQNKLPNDQEGFTLLEVLIAMLILSIAITSFIGGMGGILRFTKRGEETTRSLWELEKGLFDLEGGLRTDLVSYGGRLGNGEDSFIEIKSNPESGNLRHLTVSRMVKKEKEQAFEVLMLEGGIIV